MVQYYVQKEGKHVLRSDLLDSEARTVASTLLRSRPMTSAQLRRFYGEVKNLERKATDNEIGEMTENSFLPVLPLVKMMKSKVAYAAKTDNGKVSKEFQEWLDSHLDAVSSKDDFWAFLKHFEAVVGYYYGLNTKTS
jgi:CRISPR-associated protein Csm2